MSDAWLTASVDFGATQVRSGQLVLALLANEELAGLVKQELKELELISVDGLREKFSAIVQGSDEDRGAATKNSSDSPQASLPAPKPWISTRSISLSGRETAPSIRSRAATSKSGSSSTS